MPKLNPFLHIDDDRVYNPLTDRELRKENIDLDPVSVFASGDGCENDLVRDGWLIGADDDLSRHHHLRFVSLETLSTCNQKCYFCPVSVAPREGQRMPTAMFDDIVRQLEGFRETLEGVFLQNYNEPTLDHRFIDQVRSVRDAQLPVAVLSNGSGLTPAKVESLVGMGGLSYLCINLTTLDRTQYASERGVDQLPVVLRNLEFMQDKPVAERMKVVVLGQGDDRHLVEYQSIRKHFSGTRFEVVQHQLMNRAGHVEVGAMASDLDRPLAGCENLGSRPFQHLHITPRGICVLCCEDYSEKYVIGDLSRESILEVLEGDVIAQLRRWVYGIEAAPSDFICRKCIFARRRVDKRGPALGCEQAQHHATSMKQARPTN